MYTCLRLHLAALNFTRQGWQEELSTADSVAFQGLSESSPTSHQRVTPRTEQETHHRVLSNMPAWGKCDARSVHKVRKLPFSVRVGTGCGNRKQTDCRAVASCGCTEAQRCFELKANVSTPGVTTCWWLAGAFAEITTFSLHANICCIARMKSAAEGDGRYCAGSRSKIKDWRKWKFCV